MVNRYGVMRVFAAVVVLMGLIQAVQARVDVKLIEEKGWKLEKPPEGMAEAISRTNWRFRAYARNEAELAEMMHFELTKKISAERFYEMAQSEMLNATLPDGYEVVKNEVREVNGVEVLYQVTKIPAGYEINVFDGSGSYVNHLSVRCPSSNFEKIREHVFSIVRPDLAQMSSQLSGMEYSSLNYDRGLSLAEVGVYSILAGLVVILLVIWKTRRKAPKPLTASTFNVDQLRPEEGVKLGSAVKDKSGVDQA